MNAGRVRYRGPPPAPRDDRDRGLVPNETMVIEPAVDSGREPAGRVTHVVVQLPDEAAELAVREVQRHDLVGELLHIVYGERLAILGPGDDVLEARILHDSVPASRARSGRVSAREGTMRWHWRVRPLLFLHGCRTMALTVCAGTRAHVTTNYAHHHPTPLIREDRM
jgi:hypothetical protein